MLSPLQTPSKEVDVEFLVFVERYATDLLKWDILTFFADNPNIQVTASDIAQRIGRATDSVDLVRLELGDLVLLDILDPIRVSENLVIYQLTKDTYLRNMILKFGDQLTSRPSI
ncbi:MAG: hypothetical protein JXM69_21775 [Anaerolineae bacterium]|nr:hypothetical protein [Anaerolineae bacterium]